MALLIRRMRDTPHRNRPIAESPGTPPGCPACGEVAEAGAGAIVTTAAPPVGALRQGWEARCRAQSADATAGRQAARAQLRADGRGPARGGTAGERWGRAASAHMTAMVAWDREHGDTDDGTCFARDVLPGLRRVPLRVTAEATGPSQGYCSFVRRGTFGPRRRHWATLASLVSDPIRSAWDRRRLPRRAEPLRPKSEIGSGGSSIQNLAPPLLARRPTPSAVWPLSVTSP